MMTGLKDALLKAGVISAETHQAASRQEKLREQTALNMVHSKLARSTVSSSIMNLEKVATVSEFKEVARKLLLEDSSDLVLKEVKRIAHNLKEVDGGKKLVWLIMSLTNDIGKVKSEFREQVINRSLRSSNPTNKIPSEWRK